MRQLLKHPLLITRREAGFDTDREAEPTNQTASSQTRTRRCDPLTAGDPGRMRRPRTTAYSARPTSTSRRISMLRWRAQTALLSLGLGCAVGGVRLRRSGAHVPTKLLGMRRPGALHETPQPHSEADASVWGCGPQGAAEGCGCETATLSDVDIATIIAIVDDAVELRYLRMPFRVAATSKRAD